MEGIVRPEVTILPEGSLVPAKNVISPAPNQFTHEVTRQQPYYFIDGREGGPPDGQFEAGTKVVLLVHDGDYCRVADSQGLYVQIAYGSLRKL